MRIGILILSIFNFVLCFSQVEFSAEVNSNKVNVNQVFTYTISSNTNCQIYQPNFNGLQVVGGPFQSSSSSMNSLNGKTTKTKILKYTYQLRANKAGDFTISESQMQCTDQGYKTKAIKIKVSNTNQNSTSSQNSNPNFYIKISSNKTEVYQNEPFVITLKMFARKQPQGIEELRLGEAKGITKKDLNANQTSYETKPEVINGLRYYTVVLKQELCYAQVSGDVTIKPYYISALFTKGFFQQYRDESNSNSLNIKVRKMPSKQPKNYNGLVGDFKLEHTINKTSVNQGEAIDLNLKISGKGNLNGFDDPVLDLPNDFDQFDPEIKNNVKTNSNGTSGSISFNYVLVPTFYGDYTIPAYSFSFFDLGSKKYKTLTTGEFKIHVIKPDNSHGEIITQKKDVVIEESDIRYIHTMKISTYRDSDLKAASIGHYSLISLPFLVLWIILYMKKRKSNISEEDRIKVTRKKARKSATKYLESCKQLQQSGQDTEAIKALSGALKSFLKDKLSLTESDLNAKNINELLTNSTTKLNFDSAWKTIEMYQYAPVNKTQVDLLIKQTEQLINEIDNQL